MKTMLNMGNLVEIMEEIEYIGVALLCQAFTLFLICYLQILNNSNQNLWNVRKGNISRKSMNVDL